MIRVLGVPMILHGLYDTLLKKDMHMYALLSAIASFAYLAFLIEWAKRREDEPGMDRMAVAA